MFNITGAPSVLETIAYLAYLVPVLLVFLWPAPTRGHPVPAARSAGAASNPETSQHVAA